MSEGSQLPKWDLTNVYPGLDSVEFEQAKQDVLNVLSSGGIGVLGENTPVKDLGFINAIALTVPTQKLNQLAYLDAVEYISEDKPVHAFT